MDSVPAIFFCHFFRVLYLVVLLPVYVFFFPTCVIACPIKISFTGSLLPLPVYYKSLFSHHYLSVCLFFFLCIFLVFLVFLCSCFPIIGLPVSGFLFLLASTSTHLLVSRFCPFMENSKERLVGSTKRLLYICHAGKCHKGPG